MDTLNGMKGVDYKDYRNILPYNKFGKKWGKRSEINKIIVHQSLSDGTLEAINNYLISPNNHISESGCPHICYHICIGKDGTVYLCNNFEDETWHTKGQNSKGLAICVLGNFNGVGWNKGHNPTKAQEDSLSNLLKHLITNLSLSPMSIYGHYHYGKPACPGYSLSNIVEGFRRGVIINNPTELKTIKDIQNALISLKYELPKYGSDGVYGEETKTAIVKFQFDNQLNISGYPNEETRALLYIKIHDVKE